METPAERSAIRLSVLLCAYTLERWDDICEAVESLRHQTHRPAEIILVSDHNLELLSRAEVAFPDVRTVANSGPRGLSGARNTGVALATGDVIAFLDDDAAADPRWAERLLDAYSDEQVVGVGGAVVPEWRAPRPSWFPDEFLWVVGCSYEGLPRTRADVRNPIGANMSFRRDVFGAVGGFDSAIGRLGKDAAGCEETEFSIRASQVRAGARIVLEPTALCRHKVPADRVTREYFRRRCRAEGRSKALVSKLSGTDSALSSERTYLRRTLPTGISRGLRELARGERSGGARAWTIIEGAALTVAGYLLGRVELRHSGPTTG
jgi:GT2 family glycosyltransferase